MTPTEQLNLAIAESEGFTVQFNDGKQLFELISPNGKWEEPFDADGGSEYHCWNYIPNYSGDLNLMHELELKLNQKEDAEYRHKYLPEVVGGCLAICITATALQRAEAYAKVKGIYHGQ